MRYFRPCPYCGANLDPGERCECQDKKEQVNRFFASVLQEEENGQMAIQGKAGMGKPEKCCGMAG